ncbi:DUF167 domain-containing protein [soil metagenome]
MIELTEHAGGTILLVRAQPGARQNSVLGEHAGALRVAVTAPPEDGKANAAIAEVLANAIGCKGAAIALLSGETSRQKRFLVQGIGPVELRERLGSVLTPDLFDS